MIFIVILIMIVCLLLVLAVLAQNSKGGISANLGNSTQLMGVKKTGDFLEKTTWGLAIGLIVLCLGANLIMKNSAGEGNGDTPSSINSERAKESGDNLLQENSEQAPVDDEEKK